MVVQFRGKYHSVTQEGGGGGGRCSRDLLGAFLEGHTQALLESKDLLQVPTQASTVCTAQPTREPTLSVSVTLPSVGHLDSQAVAAQSASSLYSPSYDSSMQVGVRRDGTFISNMNKQSV